MNTTKKLIVIVGTTAIGKTSLSIALAQHFNCGIISADSRQFFKEMAIGTAAPTPQEQAQATHHLVQHISVTQKYSVGDFEKEALACLEKLYQSSDYAILIGGSGLYIDAVCKGLDDFPEIAPEIRHNLQAEFQEKGIGYLQELLKEKDPLYYEQVDTQNPQRMIRALEVCLQSGATFSSFRKQEKQRKHKARPFEVVKIGLTAQRETIYDRINQRVDMMMEQGLLHEVKSLLPYRQYNALQTVGYKELFTYLDGVWDLPTAVSEIKKNTRRFAKRQITWFKRDQKTQWFDYQTPYPKIIRVLSNIF